MPKELEFGTDNLSEEARQPFKGEIVYAKYPCDCDQCQKGAAKLEGQFGGEDRDKLHIKMEAIDGTYDKKQHEWLVPSKTIKSKWGAFNQRLEQLGVMPEIQSEGLEALVGKVFTFKSEEIEVGVGDNTTDTWLPIDYYKNESGSKEVDLS